MRKCCLYGRCRLVLGQLSCAYASCGVEASEWHFSTTANRHKVEEYLQALNFELGEEDIGLISQCGAEVSYRNYPRMLSN